MPTGMGAPTTVSETVLITVTLLELMLATEALPLGATVSQTGVVPVGIAAPMTVSVAVSMVCTLFEPELVT
ncbi:hypothetical protein GCM10010416_74060 [Streptomyces caniferus]